jgi:hypothetical protein
MKPEQILKHAPRARSVIETAQLSSMLKVYGNPEHTTFRIKDIEGKGIRVFFKKKHSLTVFETGMLYCVLIINRLPYDYANFHKCEAGKNFFENIEKITKFVIERKSFEVEFEKEEQGI